MPSWSEVRLHLPLGPFDDRFIDLNEPGGDVVQGHSHGRSITLSAGGSSEVSIEASDVSFKHVGLVSLGRSGIRESTSFADEVIDETISLRNLSDKLVANQLSFQRLSVSPYYDSQRPMDQGRTHRGGVGGEIGVHLFQKISDKYTYSRQPYDLPFASTRACTHREWNPLGTPISRCLAEDPRYRCFPLVRL